MDAMELLVDRRLCFFGLAATSSPYIFCNVATRVALSASFGNPLNRFLCDFLVFGRCAFFRASIAESEVEVRVIEISSTPSCCAEAERA